MLLRLLYYCFLAENCAILQSSGPVSKKNWLRPDPPVFAFWVLRALKSKSREKGIRNFPELQFWIFRGKTICARRLSMQFSIYQKVLSFMMWNALVTKKPLKWIKGNKLKNQVAVQRNCLYAIDYSFEIPNSHHFYNPWLIKNTRTSVKLDFSQDLCASSCKARKCSK